MTAQRPNLDARRMAGAKLLHAVELAQFLPGFQPSAAVMQAVDDTIDYICWRHPKSPTARFWENGKVRK